MHFLGYVITLEDHFEIFNIKNIHKIFLATWKITSSEVIRIINVNIFEGHYSPQNNKQFILYIPKFSFYYFVEDFYVYIYNRYRPTFYF